MDGSGVLGSSLYLRYKSGHHQFSRAFETTGVEGVQSREESKGERKKSHWYFFIPFPPGSFNEQSGRESLLEGAGEILKLVSDTSCL